MGYKNLAPLMYSHNCTNEELSCISKTVRFGPYLAVGVAVVSMIYWSLQGKWLW